MLSACSMGWEQRWREMIFAGGALAATACMPLETTLSDAGTEGERAADASLSEGGAKDGGAPDAGPVDAADEVQAVSFCCNANPDPCCPLAYCSGAGPDASIYITCEQNRAQCEAMNGGYTYEPDGSLGCRAISTTSH
jgi:hypothetical protein